MIRGVAHVCFFVSDLERSAAFYRDVIGLKPGFKFASPPARFKGEYFHAGGRTFVEIFQATQPPVPAERQSYHHFCLEVRDIEAYSARLREHGVEVSQARKGNDGTLQAWLKDPDGNAIELQQYLAESSQMPFVGGTPSDA